MVVAALLLLLAAPLATAVPQFDRSSAVSSARGYATSSDYVGYSDYSYSDLPTATISGALPTAIAAPTDILTPSPSARASSSPCAGVADAVSQWSAESPRPTYRPLIEAELGYACLQQVPVKQGDATELINYLLAALQFQSNLNYLKSPPSSYVPGNPPIDLVAEINAVQQQVDDNGFDSQNDLEIALSRIIDRAYDGHLAFHGYASQLVFGWIRDPRLTLASVKQQADSLPQIYLVADLNRTGAAASPVTTINGQNATAFLQAEADGISLHDPDARWNTMFFSQAGTPSFGAFISPQYYPGPDTTVELADGTSRTYPTLAEVLFPTDWEFIDDGESFYANALELSSSYYSSAEQASTDDEPVLKRPSRKGKGAPLPRVFPSPGLPRTALKHLTLGDADSDDGGKHAKRDVPPGYPEPFVTQADDDSEIVYLSGFFEPYDGDDSGLAVLALQTFLAEEDDVFLDFQDTVARFLAEAKRRASKKIIIDVSFNGGGTALLGYEVFRQFFPDLGLSPSLRFRATDPVNLVGGALGDIAVRTGLVLDYSNWVEPDLGNFTSWRQLYGPEQFGDGQYSNPVQWDLCHASLRHGAPSNYFASGCPGSPTPDTRPFASADMVVLTNGYCASACAIFKELMSTEGNVPAIALGGRPQTGPMQAIGGTRGGVVVANDQLDLFTEAYVQFGASSPTSVSAGLPQPLPIYASVSVNSQNNYRAVDDVPLQFIEDLAGCRVWETAAMSLDVRQLWSAVAAAAWSGPNGGIDASKCVDGSVVNEEAKGSAADFSQSAQTSGSGSGGSRGGGSGGGDDGSSASGLSARAGLAASVSGLLACAFWLL